jgi:hypothetical protein
MSTSTRDLLHAPSPRRVEAGRINIRKRWGPPRIARLDSIDPVSREIILAILQAAANKKALDAAAEKAQALA